MSKQDRTHARTATDLERKYNLGQTKKESKDNNEKVIQLSRAFSQFQTLVNAKIEELKKKVSEFACYPVGTIHISMEDTNPATSLGGKWELYLEGYFVLGKEQVDEEEREFEYAPNKCYVWTRVS